MLQEIITYLIVALAVIVTTVKIVKRFTKKKKQKKVDFKKDKITMAHNCSDCSAECVLRDLPKKVIADKSKECTTNYSQK